MISIPLQNVFAKRIVVHQNYFFRYVRNIARYDEAPKAKLLKRKVKTVTEYDDSPRFESYKDFITDIKKRGFGTELEVEEQFLNEDYYGDAFERCDAYYEMGIREEKQLKSAVKKNIIGRKYFQLDKETTLLTHAAKEQIRYLHNSNPSEWNPKALSECFPISENGVKRLLKNKFVQTCPEKIKLHDEEIAKRWEILKSGKFSDKIAPLTWKLYKEGKLVDDYFSGNPNLPTAPPTKKIIEIKEEKTGEFSNIVKSYFDYQKKQKQKLLESGKDNLPENQLSLRDNNTNIKDLKRLKKYKYATEELEVQDPDPEVYPVLRKNYYDNIDDIPFSQFKENLREETSQKLKSKYKNEYHDFVMKETSRTKATERQASKPVSEEDYFSTIPKYEKKSIDVMYERNGNTKNVYKYDEKLGYQYPIGKNMKGVKVKIPSNLKKGKHVKIGQCVYDADGEFLYKVYS